MHLSIINGIAQEITLSESAPLTLVHRLISCQAAD